MDIIYSISADTANSLLDESLLSQEILASGIAVPATGLLNLLKMERLNDVLTITYIPGLTVSDSGVSDGVVAAHSGTAITGIVPGPTGDIIQDAIDEHAAIVDVHHVRYTDAEAIAASSGALDHHVRYTDAEAFGVAVQVATTGIEEAITNHTAVVDAHHARYTDSEAQAAATGAVTLQTAFDASPTVQAIGEPSMDFKRVQMSGAGLLLQDITPDTPIRFRIEDEIGNRIVDFKVGQIDFQGFGGISVSGDAPIMRITDDIDAINVWPEDVTFTSPPGSILKYSSTTIHDYPNVSFAALNLQGTIEHKQSAFAFNHFLLFNNGNIFKNTNGIAANFGPGQTFIAQPTLQADGASVTMSQNRDFLSQPTFNTINGGALSIGTWTQVQLLGQINAGITLTTRNAIQIGALLGAGGTLTTERGIRLENLNRGTTIIGIDSVLTGTSKTFINHLGTSPSNFGGAIRMNSGIPLVLGTFPTNRVELTRSAAGTMRMRGAGGTNNEGLEWDFDTATANNVEVNSSTGAGLQFNLDAISFGTTAADPTSANWFTIFTAPSLRTPSVGGEYSDVLWTAGGTLDIDGLTMSNVQGFKINAPAVILNGGTIDDLSNLFVDAMSSFGATRFQALRVRGRTRLDGLVTYNHAVLSTLTASVSGLTLPANNNGRHVILMDADASGPWTIQGIVNDQVGDSVYVMNSGVNDFVIGHQDAGSAPSERIISPTASGIVLSQHQMVKLWYNSTLSRWNVLEHTGT